MVISMMGYRLGQGAQVSRNDRREMRHSGGVLCAPRRAALGLALSLAIVCLLGTVAVAPPEAAGAAPPTLTEFCPSGSGGGECSNARGIGVEVPSGEVGDVASGDVYVSDQGNRRLQKFNAWGEFMRAWGWDVVESGPGDDTTPPEDEFEICVAGLDVCKAGIQGPGVGQIGSPQGVAVDGAGDVYVVDRPNQRVQKFSPDGDFLLMFGGEVNKTKSGEPGSSEAERNLCTAASGDECGVGTLGTGNGQFGAWTVLGSYITIDMAGTATATDDTIYVGDENRIQEFDTDGNYMGEIAIPGETVAGLAVAPSGDLYASFGSTSTSNSNLKDDIQKLTPTGASVCTLDVETPSAIAVDAAGNVHVYSASHGNNPEIPQKVVQFDSGCGEINRFDAKQDGLAGRNTGLATTSACGIEGAGLFISNTAPAFVRRYGPPPQDFDPPCSPPSEEPPAIADQYAVSVGSEGAMVRAEINPLFWPDTRYYVQYGTGKCSEGGCGASQPMPPGSLLTKAVASIEITTTGVFLGDLEPGTTYHYRFVAESSGGGPVFGVDPDGEGPLDASAEAGLEATFTTYPPPPKAKVDCPNQAFRTGLSAPLSDCRAYEMVSPLDKSNGDVANDETFLFGSPNLQLSSPDGARVIYSSLRSFGSPQGAPLVNQYLSSRDPVTGWSTESIAPPRTSVPFYPVGSEANLVQFKAFSENLCEGWFIQDTDLALLPGAPPAVPNIYRRDFDACGAGGYGLITPVAPPHFPTPNELEANSQYYPTVQGVSPDGSRTLLRADAVLTADACDTVPGTEEGKGIFQVYLHVAGDGGGGLRLVSVLPGGAAACVHSSGGTAQGTVGSSREDGVYHALSEDASRVFWSTSGDPGNQVPFGAGGGDQPGPLYVRLNPEEEPSAQELGAATGTGNLNPATKVVTALSTTSGAFAVGQRVAGKGVPAGTTITAIGATTITLSANPTESVSGAALEAWSACTEPQKACTLPISTASNTRFWGADPGGDTAIYTAGGALYEFDVATETSTPIAATGARGVLGMSEDASRVYFASTTVLTGETQNEEGDKAIAGQPNLYLHERGVGLVFIGTLADSEVRDNALANSPPAPIVSLPDRRTARVSPDGLHAAFLSAAPLSGYDNTDLISGERDAELFLYDTPGGGAVGELACISCNPSGARPRGRDIGDRWTAAELPGWPFHLRPSQPLSADGDRLFFESFGGLVLRDTNGQRDVYEWQRAASAAECEEVGAELHVAGAGGCLSLISSGKSSLNSEFVDASASGKDVFFITAGSLLPQDFGLLDVYNAREGGGFQPPSSPKPPCEGEACQPAPPPPEAPNPASSSYEGEGNVVPGAKPKPCGKGKRRVTRGGKKRCVRKKKRRAGRGVKDRRVVEKGARR
jgi:NHL repeat